MTSSRFNYPAPKKQYTFSIGPSADDLFTSFRLQIPIAQRQYAWQGDVGEDETDNLFEFIYDVHRVADAWHKAYVNCSSAEQSRFDPSESMPTYFACGSATLLAGPDVEEYSEEGIPLDKVTERRSMVIIDGQQRLTTIAILEAALRDTVASVGRSARPNPPDYENCDFLKTTSVQNAPFLFDLTAQNRKLKTLVPVLYREEAVLEGVKDALHKICIGTLKDNNPSEGNFSLEEKAYLYFRGKLERMFSAGEMDPSAGQPESKEAELHAPEYGIAMFGLALRYGVRLGVVMEPAADPAEVLEKFIKLNTQGEPLEASDIIKTALLQSCTQDPALAQRVNKRFGEFGDACKKGKSDSKAVTNIVRVWYNSFLAQTLTSNESLIRRVREDLRRGVDFSGIGGDKQNTEQTQSEVVVESLHSTATKYHEILAAESSALAQAVMAASKAKKSFPALAMPAAYKDNFQEALHEVARAVALRCVLSPANASFSSSFEATQFRVQKKLRQGLTTPQIREELEKEIVLFGEENASLYSPSDAEEKIKALTWSTNNEQKALRIVFLTIEIYLRELLGDDSKLAVSTSLEHIAPQSGAEGGPWKPLSASEPAPLDNMGNMTILQPAVNSSYGDKPLKEKVPRYAEQTYLVTKACESGKVGDPLYKAQQSNIPGEVMELVADLKVDPEAWSPEMASKRATAIAKLFLRAIEYGVKVPTIRPTKNSTGGENTPGKGGIPDSPKNYELDYNGLKSLAYESDGKTFVMAGSEASSGESRSCPAPCRTRRAELLEEGVLVLSDGGDFYEVAESFTVQSLDQAAGILTGSSASASAWKSC